MHRERELRTSLRPAADGGRTASLGRYEASADVILYETDSKYRLELDGNRSASERTFGVSLRRLRKQRKLKQSDFAPLTAKTVARVERKTVGKPHANTLQVLSRRLGVKSDEIQTY